MFGSLTLGSSILLISLQFLRCLRDSQTDPTQSAAGRDPRPRGVSPRNIPVGTTENGATNKTRIADGTMRDQALRNSLATCAIK